MGEPWLLAPEGVLRVGARVELDPAEARHLTRVLRRGAGQPLVLTDGAGTVAEGTLHESSRGRFEAEVASVQRLPQPPSEVTVALGVLHTGAMDLAVQKAVEVGAAAFVPLLATRSQLSRKAAEGRRAHWQRVADQALKQCRRAWALRIAEPSSLDDLVARTPAGQGIVADPEGGALQQIPQAVGLVLLVGPEGGLTDSEDALLQRAGWHRLALGPFVLRAETAAVVGAAQLVGRAWRPHQPR